MKLSVLSRYLVKEVLQAWLAVTVVLVAVLMTNRLVRYLADAASGNIPADVIFHLLGLKTVSYLGLVLPAAFFLGIVLALGRLYRDSEMAALAACGGGPSELYRALYMLAVPLTLLVALLGFWIGPAADREGSRVQAEARASVDLDALRPGRFMTSGRADGMFYMEGVSDDGRRMQNVFVHSEREGGTTLVTARSGRQELRDNGDRYIVLEHGYRLEGVPGESSWRRIDFEEHGVLIAQDSAASPRVRHSGAPTSELWERRTVRDWAELHWRLSMPLMAMLLTLVSVPLSKAEPREGRYGKLLAAVLVYVAYSNGMTIGQDWLRSERVPTVLGLWWVHGLFAVAALAWLGQRYGWFRQRLKETRA